MVSEDLLAAARRLLPGIGGEEAKEDLQVLVHQLEVLIDDERHGDTEQIRARRSQLYEKLTAIAEAAGHDITNDADVRSGFRAGAILAIRLCYGDDAGYPVDFEDLVRGAQSRTRTLLSGVAPSFTKYGAGMDFWFFEERQPSVAVAETIWSLYCFGLALQVEARTKGLGLAICVDYEQDAKTIRLAGWSTLGSTGLQVIQSLLLGAAPGHILLSRQAADILGVTTKNHRGAADLARILQVPDKTVIARPTSVQYLAPSKRRLDVVEVAYFSDNTMVAGSAHPFVHFTAIEHRDSRDSTRPGGQFIDLLATHDECVILGVTHQDLVDRYLRPAAEQRKRCNKAFWDRIVVIFPTADAARKVMDGRTVEERLESRASGLRTVVSFLRSSTSPGSEQWKVAEYQENLSFVGNWMSAGPRNSIRISPLLPGIDLKETFVVELSDGTKAYREAQNSFVAIESNSIQVGEWNLVGRVENERYQWQEVHNRSDSDRPGKNSTDAVVLIMVHGLTSRGRRVYLQLRSNMNGSTAIGLYSNISGLVTTIDAYNSASKPPPDYLFNEDSSGGSLYWHLVSNGVLTPREELPKQVWRHAAAREIDEELGLEIDRDRFKEHGYLLLHRPGRSSLYFALFSLELQPLIPGSSQRSEIQRIRKARPLCGLEEFTIADVYRVAGEGRLNKLFADNLEHVLDIYRKLGVADD